jgi:hypothetical protein
MKLIHGKFKLKTLVALFCPLFFFSCIGGGPSVSPTPFIGTETGNPAAPFVPDDEESSRGADSPFGAGERASTYVVATAPNNGKATITGSPGSFLESELISILLNSLPSSVSSFFTDLRGFFTSQFTASIGSKFTITKADGTQGTAEVVRNVIDLGCAPTDIALLSKTGHFLITCKDIDPNGLDTTVNADVADDRGIIITIKQGCDYKNLDDISSCLTDRFEMPPNPSVSSANSEKNGDCAYATGDYLDDPQTILTSVGSSIALIVDQDNGCAEDTSGGTSFNLGGILMIQVASDGKISSVLDSSNQPKFMPIPSPAGGKFDNTTGTAIIGIDWSQWEKSFLPSPGCTTMFRVDSEDSNDFIPRCVDLSSSVSGTLVQGSAVELIPGLSRAIQIVRYTNGSYLYIWDTTSLLNGSGEQSLLSESPVELTACSGKPIRVAAYNVDTENQTANIIWTDADPDVLTAHFCVVQVDLTDGSLASSISDKITSGYQPWGLTLIPLSSIDGGDSAVSLTSLQSENDVRAYISLRGSISFRWVDLSPTKETLYKHCVTGDRPTHLSFNPATGDAWVINTGHHTVQISDVDDCD